MEIPALADLLDLQEVDLQIDRLLERRQGLPELADYRDADRRRVEAAAAVAAVEEEQNALHLELDRAEGELEMIEAKLDESETRLYAGGMSGRETEHKQLEVTSLKGQRGAMEERVLGLLDATETLDAKKATADGELADATADEQRLEGMITAAWKEIDLELGRRERRKSEIIPSIPPELLALYEKLRSTKEGVAVGRLDAGQCGGCHLSLSAPEQMEAAEYDPPRCVHCRRILVL